MDYILPLAGLALVHLLAVVSPGPSFVVVAQIAAARSRRAGVMASLAMTIGAGVWAIAAMVGLQALFARFETLYTVMRIAGGLYLLWVAYRMWRHAGAPLPTAQPGQDPGSTSDVFRRALLVQLANPKLVVFMGSIFLALLPAGAPRVTRTLRIDTAVPRWHSTGLYAAPGETITVTVPQAAAAMGLKVRIGAHTDKTYHLSA